MQLHSFAKSCILITSYVQLSMTKMHLANRLKLLHKSLNASRKIMTILNRFGHIVSFSVIDEIETEFTYSAVGDR